MSEPKSEATIVGIVTPGATFRGGAGEAARPTKTPTAQFLAEPATEAGGRAIGPHWLHFPRRVLASRYAVDDPSTWLRLEPSEDDTRASEHQGDETALSRYFVLHSRQPISQDATNSQTNKSDGNQTSMDKIVDLSLLLDGQIEIEIVNNPSTARSVKGTVARTANYRAPGPIEGESCENCLRTCSR